MTSYHPNLPFSTVSWVEMVQRDCRLGPCSRDSMLQTWLQLRRQAQRSSSIGKKGKEGKILDLWAMKEEKVGGSNNGVTGRGPSRIGRQLGNWKKDQSFFSFLSHFFFFFCSRRAGFQMWRLIMIQRGQWGGGEGEFQKERRKEDGGRSMARSRQMKKKKEKRKKKRKKE